MSSKTESEQQLSTTSSAQSTPDHHIVQDLDFTQIYFGSTKYITWSQKKVLHLLFCL